MALSGNLDAQRRRDELVELANGPQGVLIEAAAELFSVSSMTIRRDLLELEAEGRVRRVRGGATSAPRARPFDTRRAMRAGAKRTIAAKALRFVPDRGSIAFDASTTISTLASTLGPRSGLSVYTNSYESFQALHPIDGVSAVLSGGSAEPTTGSLIGPVARRSMSSLYFDAFFSSADALDAADGTSEVSMEEAELKQVMAANAALTIVCVDAGKLGRRSVARALEREEISILITDLDPEDERLDPYREITEIV
ncbi:DeoR/GlpR family DNA-binding transcription regulator [Microbacterium sp. NPDC055903]